MAPRIVDLSVPIANDIPADPPIQIPSITYIDHAQSLDQILSFFPGLTAEDLPDRAGWAVERVSLSHPQRHTSRRALALSPDDERRRTGVAHR